MAQLKVKVGVAGSETMRRFAVPPPGSLAALRAAVAAHVPELCDDQGRALWTGGVPLLTDTALARALAARPNPLRLVRWSTKERKREGERDVEVM